MFVLHGHALKLHDLDCTSYKDVSLFVSKQAAPLNSGLGSEQFRDLVELISSPQVPTQAEKCVHWAQFPLTKKTISCASINIFSEIYIKMFYENCSIYNIQTNNVY